MVNRTPWTPADTRCLRSMAKAGASAREIADYMGRSVAHLRQRASRHGIAITRQIAEEVAWTKKRDAQLTRLYATLTGDEIAARMGLSKPQVYRRAHALGLQKSAEWIAECTRNRWRAGRHHNSRAAHYPKGHVPANKGLRRPGYAPGRMAETQFKKGDRCGAAARNYVPIGTEKIDPKRNVLMRKTTDDPTIFPVQRWRPVHVIVWEAANGPIPKGHLCIFRPGKKTFVASEITIDRLELVTHAENMRRNTIHNWPPELKQAMYATIALKRSITLHEKRGKTRD